MKGDELRPAKKVWRRVLKKAELAAEADGIADEARERVDGVVDSLVWKYRGCLPGIHDAAYDNEYENALADIIVAAVRRAL